MHRSNICKLLLEKNSMEKLITHKQEVIVLRRSYKTIAWCLECTTSEALCKYNFQSQVSRNRRSNFAFVFPRNYNRVRIFNSDLQIILNDRQNYWRNKNEKNRHCMFPPIDRSTRVEQIHTSRCISHTCLYIWSDSSVFNA